MAAENIEASDVPRLNRVRILASGALWATAYNIVWAAAWFLFMRREWADAFAAIGRPLPWTADVWIGWAALTLPIGVAIVAYANQPKRSASCQKALISAALPLWLLMTLGMAIWSTQESLSVRIIALDSLVNLGAMVSASFAGAWGLRPLMSRS